MWILTPSITSAFAAATGELTSASSEQLAAAFARSLLSRSKPSPQRTWLQRLKRDSWTTHLSGAISSDSLGESFTDWWTSSLAATRASHSAQPASDSGPKTHDTSGRLSQPELLQCDLVPAFLKTSTDISQWGFPTCCKTWQDWVTERRGAWRARVNAARLTRGKEFSSWPTISVNESKNSVGKSQLDRNSIPLGTMAQWHTPEAHERTHAPRKCGHGTIPLANQVILGQAAPASSNTLGSRQWLWPTARSLDGSVNESLETWTARHHRKEAEGINLHRPLPIAVMQEQAKTQDFPTPRTCDWKSSPNADSNIKRMEVGQATLAEFVHAKHKKGDLWSTPRTGATESSRPNNKGGIPLADQAKRQEQLATPQAKDHESGHRDPTIV